MSDKREKHRYLVCITAFLIASAIFCVLFFAYMRNFEKTMMEENRFQLSEVSGHIATYMQHMVTERQNELIIVADSYMELPNESEKEEYLDRMAEKLGFEYIGISDSDGMLSAPDVPALEDISERNYFKAARLGEPSVSSLTRQIFSDRVVSGVMMGVLVPDGSERVVVALLDTSQLGENIRVDSFNGEGYSYIINREGELVLNSRSREFNNLFQSFQNMQFEDGYNLQKFETDIRERREGMAAYSDLGVAKYVYYRPLDVNDWTIVSTVPKGVVTERTGTLSRNLAVLCIAAMLVFLLLLLAVTVLYLRLERKKQANQARTTFLANMSHDMRTPMNAMIGMAAIAGAHADEPETVRDCTRKIASSGKHLLGLINDVLDMSKIESGKLKLVCEAMSLSEILHETVDLVYAQISAKHQQFSIAHHQVEHEYFFGDSLRLRQVFVNILTNASKFTPEGGSITVHIEELPSEDENKARMRFSFTDNGIGMKPEFLKHVFTAFSRERDSKVDKTDGSGLGMAISKSIVELMEGSITVTSEEGKGSTFVVTVPFLLNQDQQKEEEIPFCRILVVDGDEEQGNETVRILRTIGALADREVNGASAAMCIKKACAAGEDYQIVLLDRVFFDSGEWRYVRETISPEQCIVLAAYGWEDIREKAFASGIQSILPKPIFCSTLLSCLRDLLLKESAVSPAEAKEGVLAGKRILMAEDNELNMEIAIVMLKDAGASAVCAENGKACLEQFCSAPEGYFDLILMDIQMPVMNGYEAAMEIRQLERADAKIPIVAMSANVFAEDMEAARKAGMSGYLVKPIDMEIWLKEIAKIISVSH